MLLEKQKLYVWGALGGCLLLAACSSAPECPEICSIDQTCAPKKATSRPYQIKGIWYYPQPHYEYDEVGIASYYGGGDVFHGRPTATGERFDKNEVSAAHKTLPLPCIAEVTNLENGRQIQLKVNDRGPFVEGRIIDVSRRTAQLLGFENKGTAKVRVRTLVPESLALNGIDKPQVMLAEKKTPPVFLDSPLPPMNAALMPRLPDHLFEEAEEAPVLMKVSNKAVKAAEPSKNSRGLFIDIGAYGREEEANALLKTLGDLTKSNAQSIHASGPTPYAVRVGPFSSMAEANQILDRVLDAGHGMARIIIH